MIVCIEFPANYVCFPPGVLFKVSYIAMWLIHFLILNKLWVVATNKEKKST